MELVDVIAYLIPIETHVGGNRCAFLLPVAIPTYGGENRDHVERSSIAVTEHAIEELAYLLPVQHVRDGRLTIGVDYPRDEACQPHVTVREARHVVDVLGRHCRVPAVDHPPHHFRVKRFDAQFRNSLRIGRRTTAHGNDPQPAAGTLHRVPEREKMLKLCLVCHDHQSNFGISLMSNAVDQLGQASIVALLEVDHGVPPRRLAAQFQREPRLADTRRTLNVEVVDAARCEVEINPSLRQVRLHRRGCLVAHPVFIAVLPLIQRQRARRSPRPSCRNGRMLIAPPLKILAAIDHDPLCSVGRQSRAAGRSAQDLFPIAGSSFSVGRSTGDHHEPPTLAQSLQRNRLVYLGAQPGGLAGPPRLELPTCFGGTEPEIGRRGPIGPSVAAIVGRSGLGVHQGARRSAPGSLGSQELAHELVQAGVVQCRDSLRRNLEGVSVRPRVTHFSSTIAHAKHGHARRLRRVSTATHPGGLRRGCVAGR